MSDVTYFPGCSLHGTAREYDESFRGVSKLLDIALHELEDWTCCGSTSAHCTDEALAVALPVRNLRIAERHDREMIVPCVACYSRFKAAEAGAKEHPEYLETPYEGKVAVRYALDFFCEPSRSSEVKAKVVKPLAGLKVACYYGCLAVRPPELTGVARYENPEHMDRLMELLGAETVDWSYKTDCCGASLTMTRTDIVVELTEADPLDGAGGGGRLHRHGLQHVPRQPRHAPGGASGEGRGDSIPVFYFTELMGLAMGHPDVKTWLGRHVTDSREAVVE